MHIVSAMTRVIVIGAVDDGCDYSQAYRHNTKEHSINSGTQNRSRLPNQSIASARVGCRTAAELKPTAKPKTMTKQRIAKDGRGTVEDGRRSEAKHSIKLGNAKPNNQSSQTREQQQQQNNKKFESTKRRFGHSP